MATQSNTGERNAATRATGWGLVWAFVMLVILAFWLRGRDTDFGILLWGPVLVLALAALALGVRELRFSDAPTATREALLARRRQLALTLFVGALVLLALAVWLAAQHGLASFPEVSSMVVMALIAAGAGVSLRIQPGGEFTQEHVLQALVRNRQRVIIGLFAAAVVFGALGLWRALAAGVTPEAAGGLLLFLLFVGVGLWQAITPPENASIQDMRLLILFTGLVGGLIVAVATAWRTWLSWRLIFPADVPMAQSEGVWRLWLYAYIEMFALAVLFGSLLLARADIRQNAAMRRLLFGYNTFLTGLLVLVTLVIANVVVYATYPLNFEFSKTLGLHGLSDSSKNLLRALKEDTHVYVLITRRNEISPDLRNLMENLQAYTRRLQVTFLSPDLDSERYRKLVIKYPAVRTERTMVHSLDPDEEVAGRGVLIVYGPDVGTKTPHAFIPLRELYDVRKDDPRDPSKQTILFQGEKVIMTQLRLLVNREQKPTIYFTQGNGELKLQNAMPGVPREVVMLGGDTRGGMGLLLERLKKDNYEVRGLVWKAPPRQQPPGELMVYSQKTPKDKHEVPADAQVVIIADPRAQFSPEVRSALLRFLESGGKDKKGGKLILLAGAAFTSQGAPFNNGLEDLLRVYGVQLGDGFLMRVPPNPELSRLEVVANVPANSRNPVAADFRTREFPLGITSRAATGLARSVRSVGPPHLSQAETMLEVGEAHNGLVWSETDLNALRDPERFTIRLEDEGQLEMRRAKEPVPVVVAAKGSDGRPKLVVFGDARFASNLVVRSPYPYYDFLTSTIEWLVERPENMGIKPKESGFFQLPAEKVNGSRLVWLPLGLILLTLVGTGLGIWVVRRR
jgi:hypothetical protein